MKFVARAAVAVCLATAAPTGSALGHAILMRSEPAAAAAVPPGPLKIVLEYNSRIDFGRSVVKLSAPDATSTTLALDRQAANVALANADPKVPGAYTIRWQVLATDGHITRGIVPFVVTTAPSAPDPAGK